MNDDDIILASYVVAVCLAGALLVCIIVALLR